MGKRYPYLTIGAVAVSAALITWLIVKNRTPQIEMKPKSEKEVRQYFVAAPSYPLIYNGTGMPFGIEYFEIIPPCHVEVDNNGIGRLVRDQDGMYGGAIAIGDAMYFVTEETLNYHLHETRLKNSNTLLQIFPWSLAPLGYTTYITGGKHIGRAVYVTLTGQIGMCLYDLNGREMFVPIDIVDSDPTIWEKFAKPSGGYYEF